MPRQGKWQRTFIEEFEGIPWLLGAGFSQPGSSYPLTPHRHKGHEFTFIAEGEVCWETAAGAKLHLQGGAMGMTLPGVEHWGRRNTISPCRLIWFIADLAEHESEELRALGKTLSKGGDRRFQASANLAALMREMKDAVESYAAKPSDSLRKARLRASVEHALTLIALELQEPGKAEPKPKRELASIVRKLVAADSRRPPELPDMAAAAKIGLTRFAKLFKEETGMTPADFALRLRCELAAETLRSAKLSVSETAFRHGFSSGQHFAGAFKRHMGFSPGKCKVKERP